MRNWMIALASAIFLAVHAAAGEHSPPIFAERTIYYSDLNLTNAVGAYTIYCDGRTESWGELSIYATFEANDC